MIAAACWVRNQGLPERRIRIHLWYSVRNCKRKRWDGLLKPMWPGQSNALGTNDGDQQYVKGIFCVWTRVGPSENGTASRWMLSLHSLITSPNLHLFSPVIQKEHLAVRLPLPRQPLYDTVGEVVYEFGIGPAGFDFDICQRVGISASWTPRHGKHEVQRY